MPVVCCFGSRHGYDPSKIRSVLLKLKQRFGDRLTIHVGNCKGVGQLPRPEGRSLLDLS